MPDNSIALPKSECSISLSSYVALVIGITLKRRRARRAPRAPAEQIRVQTGTLFPMTHAPSFQSLHETYYTLQVESVL